MVRPNWKSIVAAGGALALAATSMVVQASSRPDPGIYLQAPGKAGDDGLVRLHGLIVTHTKMKGLLKTMATQGLLKGSVLGIIDGSSAEVRAPAGDVAFDFYLDPKPAPKPGDMPNMDMDAAMQMATGDFLPPGVTRADQIILLRMTPKKDAREVEMAKGGGGRSKDAVAISVEEIGEHAFRVRPKSALEPGEYAFTFTMPGQGGSGGQLWDFGVDRK